MAELTPYDTGERAEPVFWVATGAPHRPAIERPAEDYGKVDFDDEEGATIATLWIERQPDGSYTLKGYTNEPLKIEVEEQL